MRQTDPKYHPGLEFYVHPSMGLCGIENDARGDQGTYQYLTPDEALEWLRIWLANPSSRKSGYRRADSNQESRPEGTNDE